MVMRHTRKVGRVDAVGTAATAADAAATQKVRRRRPDGGAISQTQSVHVIRLCFYRLLAWKIRPFVVIKWRFQSVIGRRGGGVAYLLVVVFFRGVGEE